MEITITNDDNERKRIRIKLRNLNFLYWSMVMLVKIREGDYIWSINGFAD